MIKPANKAERVVILSIMLMAVLNIPQPLDDYRHVRHGLESLSNASRCFKKKELQNMGLTFFTASSLFLNDAAITEWVFVLI